MTMRRKRKNMAKYIDREALVDWLKRIPLKDLSDGLGLCRVIMENDFKKAIKEMPEGIIADAVPVVRCRECKHRYKDAWCEYVDDDDNFYCARGERKGGSDNEP